jgi:hypothetical protein
LTTFEQDWRRFHGDSVPLSFALRDANKPWVRFHSLPQSKRYADTPQERDILLRRANAVAVTVLGNDPTWLVQLGPVGESEAGWTEGALKPRREFALQPAGEYAFDELVWPAYAALSAFALGTFNTLIDDVANERAFRTLWMSAANGRIFAPYDGGMDVFMESDAAIAALKARFRDWLPLHGDL